MDIFLEKQDPKLNLRQLEREEEHHIDILLENQNLDTKSYSQKKESTLTYTGEWGPCNPKN